MARNIDNRLVKLKARRSGTDRLNRLNDAERLNVQLKSYVDEPWQKRAVAMPYTKYALGAMAPVDAAYTNISIETAERVKKQLREGLTAMGFAVDFRLQGSVPLNIHIRGVSDVDLLNLDDYFFTYDTTGVIARSGNYTPAAPGDTSMSILKKLRAAAEKILQDKYPKATVDTTGGKAIALSGGSLARPVDVVPCHWYNSLDYQLSGQEHDRGVIILNKKIPETLRNWPFLHIRRVTERCDSCSGGLRSAIRLCKNVKADAEDEGLPVTLPSFDIAATMYHANQTALLIGSVFELAILVETQRHLDDLWNNQLKAKALRVPDGSRLIFDTPEKLKGLLKLSSEMDDLLIEVAKEHCSPLRTRTQVTISEARQVLTNVYIPAAA